MREWTKMLIALAIGTEAQAAKNSAAQQHDRRDAFLRREESWNL